MSLNGPWLAAVVTVVLVTGFAAAVWFWPRWSGPGTRALLARAGVLFGVNALVLLTAAVLLNNTFGFFADWGDLLGVTTGGTTSAHGGGDAVVAVNQAVRPASAPGSTGVPVGNVSGRAPSGPVVVPVTAQAGAGYRILTYTVVGAASGIRAQVVVALPAAYFAPAQAKRRFPVIETFHGYPGHPTQWMREMGLGSVWQQEAAADHIGEAIIVSPDVEYPAGVDSECVDGGSAGPQVETWASQDVPNWVLATFRARSDRQSWATIGLSAGGWCAAVMTMHHPDRFSAAIVLGGYFRPDFSRYCPFTPSSPAGRHYDLVRLAATTPPPVALWLQTSKTDTLSYSTSADLIAAARPPLAVQSTVLPNAGHRYSVWKAGLPQALRWLGHTVPGFAGGA